MLASTALAVTSDQPAPASTPVVLPYPRAAMVFVVGLVVALLFVAIHLASERGRRTEYENFAELTAVGDQHWYNIPSLLPATPETVATLKGQSLVPVSYRRVELRDVFLNLAGQDDQTGLRLYTTKESVPAREGEDLRRNEPVYFLKVDRDFYLRLQAARDR